MKKILIMLLCVVMVFGLCACGASEATEEPKETEKTTEALETEEKETEEETSAPEGFAVTVVDQNGAAVVGAMVQICKDSCVPGITNEEGVATIIATIDSEGYALKVASLPEGYTYEGEDVYLEEGMTEYTLTVTAA